MVLCGLGVVWGVSMDLIQHPGCVNKRIKHSFPVINICDNVLQPNQRSGEGCNTLLHEGFANVDTRKRMLYRHCYRPSLPAQWSTIHRTFRNNWPRASIPLINGS